MRSHHHFDVFVPKICQPEGYSQNRICSNAEWSDGVFCRKKNGTKKQSQYGDSNAMPFND
jgi:hypothetical protein